MHVCWLTMSISLSCIAIEAPLFKCCSALANSRSSSRVSNSSCGDIWRSSISGEFDWGRGSWCPGSFSTSGWNFIPASPREVLFIFLFIYNNMLSTYEKMGIYTKPLEICMSMFLVFWGFFSLTLCHLILILLDATSSWNVPFVLWEK